MHEWKEAQLGVMVAYALHSAPTVERHPKSVKRCLFVVGWGEV
jgi:hypothetical protein